jgi:hypothetical protein
MTNMKSALLLVARVKNLPMGAADALIEAHQLLEAAKPVEFKVGDRVTPDYDVPGWRMKTLKVGTVVAVDGVDVVVKFSAGEHRIPRRMLKLATPLSAATSVKEGDTVYRQAVGSFGTQARVAGVVFRSRSGDLRVRIVGGSSAIGALPVGKIMPLDDLWLTEAEIEKKNKDAASAKSSVEDKKAAIRVAAQEAVQRELGKHPSKPLKDAEVGDRLLQVASEGKWGTGNPEKLFRMTFTVIEVQGTRITALDEQGNEATFTLKTPDMVVTMD